MAATVNGHGDYTYADGFGVWHAYVKVREGGEILVARGLILDELGQREDRDLAAYVRRAVSRHPEQDRAGFIHFFEGKD